MIYSKIKKTVHFYLIVNSYFTYKGLETMDPRVANLVHSVLSCYAAKLEIQAAIGVKKKRTPVSETSARKVECEQQARHLLAALVHSLMSMFPFRCQMSGFTHKVLHFTIVLGLHIFPSNKLGCSSFRRRLRFQSSDVSVL